MERMDRRDLPAPQAQMAQREQLVTPEARAQLVTQAQRVQVEHRDSLAAQDHKEHRAALATQALPVLMVR